MIAPDVLKRATAAGVLSAAVIGGTALLAPSEIGNAGPAKIESHEETDEERTVHPAVGNRPVLRRPPRAEQVPKPGSASDARSSGDDPRLVVRRNDPEEPRSREARNGDAERAFRKLKELYRRKASDTDETNRGEASERRRQRREVHRAIQRAIRMTDSEHAEEPDLRQKMMQDLVRRALERATQRSQAGDFPTHFEPAFDGEGTKIDELGR